MLLTLTLANNIVNICSNISCNVHEDQIIMFNTMTPSFFYASFVLDNNRLSLVYRNDMYTDKWKGIHYLDHSEVDSVALRIVQDICQFSRSS
jgi:hypothetical protein